ncbi:hypothetical protein [Corynebacterium belfantii]|uniref:hypothetical protein n=1 Tax=Corynebacterium belfantii TaxID=2014537 RepID=UPI0018D46731|nr:hypothetical protein [Corynebacterium belfantii]MBG9259870.1 hypothetical protein [Corynebacterium belfantii]MBG9266660.1 hypothetical protein [Corynebacterium belfantii]
MTETLDSGRGETSADIAEKALSHVLKSTEPELTHSGPKNPASKSSPPSQKKKCKLFSWGRKNKKTLGHEGLDQTTKTLAELRLEDHKFDLSLKKTLGYGIISLLILQMVIMNVLFCVYAWVTVLHKGGTLSDTVLVAWLSTSIVETVGLATVVAKYLFPEAGSNWANEPSDKN